MPPTPVDTNAYGTTAELRFLDQLARGAGADLLLSNYITASDKRVVWGQVDKATVVAHARTLLAAANADTAPIRKQVAA